MKLSIGISALLVGIIVGGAGVWFALPTVHETVESHFTNTPTTEARTKIASMLPGYVSLGDVTLDGSNGSPFPFKATMSPQEDLFTASTKQPDLGDAANVSTNTTPPGPLVILTVVNKQGIPIPLYGKVFADKDVDKWMIQNVTIDSGLEQLGQPRGSFSPQAIVSGTPEGDKALADFDAAVADYKQKATAAVEQQKQDAQKIQAEKDAQVASYKANLMDAFKAGTSYKGTISVDGQPRIEPIKLVFTELTGTLVRVDASNPDLTGSKQSFTGNISFDANTDQNFYPLTMGPDKTPQTDKPDNVLWFYFAGGQLELRPTAEGLEGTAEMHAAGLNYAQMGDFRYTLKLQKMRTP